MIEAQRTGKQLMEPVFAPSVTSPSVMSLRFRSSVAVEDPAVVAVVVQQVVEPQEDFLELHNL